MIIIKTLIIIFNNHKTYHWILEFNKQINVR